MNLTKKFGFEALVLGACLLLGSSLPATGVQTQDAKQPATDNTKNNKGDQSPDSTTADKQKMNSADRDLTKKIRAALHGDSTLSTYRVSAATNRKVTRGIFLVDRWCRIRRKNDCPRRYRRR